MKGSGLNDCKIFSGSRKKNIKIQKEERKGQKVLGTEKKRVWDKPHVRYVREGEVMVQKQRELGEVERFYRILKACRDLQRI